MADKVARSLLSGTLICYIKGGVTVSSLRAFEDFTVGLRFQSSRALTFTAEQIKSFASEWDPQPPHLDEEAGRRSAFRGLVASGWHTAAAAMRLIVDSDLGLSGQGAGVAVESMRWRLPVRSGDSLRVEGTVTAARPSRSHPDSGIVEFRVIAFNQRDEAVLEATHVVMVARRSALPVAT
jgi:acyl dehydratase